MEVSQLEQHLDVHLVIAHFGSDLSAEARLRLLVRTKQFAQIKSVYREAGFEHPDRMDKECDEAANRYEQALAKHKKSAQQLLDTLQKHKEPLEKSGYSLAGYQQFDYQKRLPPTLLLHGLTYSVLLMDKGHYQASLDLVHKIQSILLASDTIGIHHKVSLLLGKATLLLLLGRSCAATIRQTQELLCEMQNQNLQMQQYKSAYVHALKQNLCHLALLNAFPPAQPLVQDDLQCLITLFTDDLFAGILQRSCSSLQHYLLVAVLMCQLNPGAFQMNHFLELHSQGVITASSPVLPFAQLLFTQFDFKASKQQLASLCLSNDLLLQKRQQEIIGQAQTLVISVYCEIYSSLPLSMVADMLALSLEQAESWMVQFIRSQELNAQIDAENQKVLIQRKMPRILEQINSRIEPVMVRSSTLVNNLKEIQKKQQL